MTLELVRLNNISSNCSYTHAERNFFINWLSFPSEIPELSLCLPGLVFLPSFPSADPSVIIKLFLYYKRYIHCLYIRLLDVWSLLAPCVSCRVTLVEYGSRCIWDTLYEIQLKCPMLVYFCVWFYKFLHSWQCMSNVFTFLCII
jgi:hypothetical protein